MDSRIVQLQAILEERQRLHGLCIYFEGASERSPDWTADDQAGWDEVVSQWRDADTRLAQLAEVMRRSAPEALADFIAARRQLHEARLNDSPLPDWERRDLTDTIERGDRFGRENYSDFYRWVSW